MQANSLYWRFFCLALLRCLLVGLLLWFLSSFSSCSLRTLLPAVVTFSFGVDHFFMVYMRWILRQCSKPRSRGAGRGNSTSNYDGCNSCFVEEEPSVHFQKPYSFGGQRIASAWASLWWCSEIDTVRNSSFLQQRNMLPSSPITSYVLATDTNRNDPSLAYQPTTTTMTTTMSEDPRKSARAIAEVDLNVPVVSGCQFISRFSHELNTCLNGILGAAQILKPLLLDSGGESALESSGYLDIILHNSKVMSNVLSDYLDFVQCQEGKLTLFPRPFCLLELLSRLHSSFEAEAQRLGVDFHLVLHPPLGREVGEGKDGGFQMHGDPVRLSQVLTSLLTNAFQAVSKRQTTIITAAMDSLSTSSDISDSGRRTSPLQVLTTATVLGQMIQLEVFDTGCGISEEQQKRLFSGGGSDISEFVEGSTRDAETTEANVRTSPGLGLGLVLSKYLVHLMGCEKRTKFVVGTLSLKKSGNTLFLTCKC